jgi:hypothetical protein
MIVGGVPAWVVEIRVHHKDSGNATAIVLRKPILKYGKSRESRWRVIE